jgi:hypothetical protein
VAHYFDIFREEFACDEAELGTVAFNQKMREFEKTQAQVYFL